MRRSGGKGRESLGVAAGGFVVISDVGMHYACPGFESLLGAFDLFRDRDRNGRVVLLAREAAGDGDVDDAGLCHVTSS